MIDLSFDLNRERRRRIAYGFLAVLFAIGYLVADASLHWPIWAQVMVAVLALRAYGDYQRTRGRESVLREVRTVLTKAEERGQQVDWRVADGPGRP